MREVEERLGAALRQWRIDQGYSQLELAERAGLSRAAVHRLESGSGVSMGTLVAVLQALDQVDALEVFTPRTELSPLEVLEQERKAAKAARRGPARVKRS
ncbi:helix-turn-helix transcriptional regulator [Nocardioides sp. W7]|uniref:helix-turn-helix domain-containing protein n=1 Tax=Nocardioides sp. W7 TaxID=2931390 RepID=UPI001FD5014F|nr:helix-turn-helix transcriptional regulator [Nocardioides sp. W7]